MLGTSDYIAFGLFILGYLIGWASPRIRQSVKTKRTRMFWRAFAQAGQAKVILGGHRVYDDYERAGLAGVGDIKALLELEAIFLEGGLGRLPSIVTSAPSVQLLQEFDLILVGGPDANWATAKIAAKVPGRFRLGDPSKNIVSIVDTESGEMYPKARQQDAGVIKKIANPFDETHHVLIIAGSFGHGTLAGAQLCREEKFLNDPIVASGEPFECLFTTEVIGDEPTRATVVAIAAVHS
jgi:hypothetical protein